MRRSCSFPRFGRTAIDPALSVALLIGLVGLAILTGAGCADSSPAPLPQTTTGPQTPPGSPYPDTSQAQVDPADVAGIYWHMGENKLVDYSVYPYRIPESDPGYETRKHDARWFFEPGPPGSEQEAKHLSGASDHVTGVQLTFSWMNLNPFEGVVDWYNFERMIEPWRGIGKKVWIEIASATKKDKNELGERTGGAPDWVYTHPTHPVPFVMVRNDVEPFEILTSRYPVYWNENYRMWWDGFVRAFAEEYNGDPAIAFVEVTGHTYGAEPNLSGGDDWDVTVGPTIEEQWLSLGWLGPHTDGGFVPDGVYMETVKDMIRMFLTHFSDETVNRVKYGPDAMPTPIAYVAHFSTEWDALMNEFARERNLIIVNNGFSGKKSPESRENWREQVASHGVPVGWVEWGPSGREDHDGIETDLRTAYEAGIGLVGAADPDYEGLSKVSFLPYGDYRPELDVAVEAWADALGWGASLLRKDLYDGIVSPTVSLTSPGEGAMISGAITISATASDDFGVAGVQFRIDGVNLGAADTTAPYEVSWTQPSPQGERTPSPPSPGNRRGVRRRLLRS